MIKKTGKARDLYTGFNVLRTESEADLAATLSDISRDIGPIDFFEQAFVRDVAYYNWGMMRYQRIATGILNNALSSALRRILHRIRFPNLSAPSKLALESWKASGILSHGWLIDPDSRRQVKLLLEEAGFDGSAVEAEAYTMVAVELEHAHRMLKFNEEGREKALRSLAKYRKTFAAHVRRNADRLLAVDKVPSIANFSEN